MKTKIFVFLLFASGLLISQTAGDSSGYGRNSKEQIMRESGIKKDAGEFHGKKEPLRRNKDVFIDKDGDGISDTRQSGMSFGKMRRRMGEGKSGPGGGGNRNGGPGSGYGGGPEMNSGNWHGGGMIGGGSGNNGGR